MAGGTPRFVVDAMLGSLARKLRIFGFDAFYFGQGPDSRLMLMAKKEGRAIVTADAQLAAGAASRKLTVFLVREGNDGRRLRSIVKQARLASISLEPGESRCATCNGELRLAGKAEVDSRVPESVAGRHRRFYLCLDCGKVYWKGGHWARLRRLSRNLNP